MLLVTPQDVAQRMNLTIPAGSDQETVIKRVIEDDVTPVVESLMGVKTFAKTNTEDYFFNPVISTVKYSDVGQTLMLSNMNVEAGSVTIKHGDSPDQNEMSLYDDKYFVTHDKGYITLDKEISSRYTYVSYTSGYDVDVNNIAQNTDSVIRELAMLQTLYVSYFQGAIATSKSKEKKIVLDNIYKMILSTPKRVPQGKLKPLGWN